MQTQNWSTIINIDTLSLDRAAFEAFFGVGEGIDMVR